MSVNCVRKLSTVLPNINT